MSTIRFDPPEIQDFDLAAETFLGGPPTEDGDPQRRASVGKPQVRPIRHDEVSDDPELLSFLDHSGSDYYLVRLTCSIGVSPDDVLDGATVGVDLRAGNGEPIAWSLSPLRLTQRVRHPKLTLGMDINLGPMLTIRGDWARADEEEQCYVYALGEREPDPEWRYRRTADDKLDGVHDMALVVQARRGAEVDGTVRISARITHRRFLIHSKVSLATEYAEFRLSPRS